MSCRLAGNRLITGGAGSDRAGTPARLNGAVSAVEGRPAIPSSTGGSDTRVGRASTVAPCRTRDFSSRHACWVVLAAAYCSEVTPWPSSSTSVARLPTPRAPSGSLVRTPELVAGWRQMQRTSRANRRERRRIPRRRRCPMQHRRRPQSPGSCHPYAGGRPDVRDWWLAPSRARAASPGRSPQRRLATARLCPGSLGDIRFATCDSHRRLTGRAAGNRLREAASRSATVPRLKMGIHVEAQLVVESARGDILGPVT